MSKEPHLPAQKKSVQKRKPDKCPIVFQENESVTIRAAPLPGLTPNEQCDELLRKTTGVKDERLANEIISSASKAMPPHRSTATNNNIIAQALSDLEPQDSIEARVIAQHTTLYSIGMSYLGNAQAEIVKGRNSRLFESDGVEEHNRLLNQAMKLLRLANETVESLTRYRRKGEQKVIVQHVNVNNGGQAVVAGSMDKPGDGEDNNI